MIAIPHQFTLPPHGFVSSIGRLTAFVSNTTILLVEDGEVLGTSRSEMGNPGVGAKGQQQVYHNAKAADRVLSDGDLREIDSIQGGFTLPGLRPWRPASFPA